MPVKKPLASHLAPWLTLFMHEFPNTFDGIILLFSES
jgi:hypothetical protein